MDTDGSTGSISRLIILGICLVVSALFSASETSLMSIGKIRVRSMVDEGVKNAGALSALLESPDKMLSAILVGNNLVNIMASAIATSLAIEYVGGGAMGLAVGLSTGAATLLILIFGEITPKTIAVRNTEKVALAMARPLLAVTALFSPLVFVLNKLTSLFLFLAGGKAGGAPPTFTEQELKTMVTVSHEEGVLQAEEKEMIHNVFEFGDGEIREIMTPRIHVISVDLEADYKAVSEIFKENTYSRMPVTRPGTDEIVGILNIKDIAFTDKKAQEFHVSDFLRQPHFVYEFHNAAKVFNEMRKDRVPMSVVLDEYGVMVGIVTTEDFIEEIVGDINDEYDDNETDAVEVGENEYIVDGTMGIDNFCEVVGVEIETDDFDSIGGFVLGKLDEFPAEGDRVQHENMEFVIESVKNNRIESLRVTLKEENETGAGSDLEHGNANGNESGDGDGDTGGNSGRVANNTGGNGNADRNGNGNRNKRDGNGRDASGTQAADTKREAVGAKAKTSGAA
ncbi:MAG: hemolysin family protein [Clostridiales bacterium]|nr:hemolysin family protein [Clostridiales bacterium]